MKKQTVNGSFPHRSDTGAALIVAVIFAAAIGIMTGSFLSVTNNEYALSSNAYLTYAAFNLAEAGVDETIWAYTQEDWSGWATSGTLAKKTISSLDLGEGRTGSISIIAEDYATYTPTLFVEGRAATVTGQEAVKQLRLTVTTRESIFLNGMLAKDTIVIGSNVPIDSYDSGNGPYDVTTNRLDTGTVGSLSSAPGAVTISAADIWGHIATGGEPPDLSPVGVYIHGETTPVGTDVDSDYVSTDFEAEFPDIVIPTLTTPFTSFPPINANKITIGSTGTPSAPEEYHLSSFSLGGNDDLIVEGYVIIVVDGDMGTGGSSQIIIRSGANAKFYVGGNLGLGGGGSVNENQQPETLNIYGTSTVDGATDFDLGGSSAFYGTVYAPHSDVDFQGSTDFFGAVAGYTIVDSGSAKFHYDEALGNFLDDNSPIKPQLGNWRELNNRAAKIDFATYSP